MEAQEIFDAVVSHIYTQKYRSYGSLDVDDGETPAYDGCLYRSPDGLKCAVGIFIDDKDYTPRMEGLGVSLLVSRFNDRIPRFIAENMFMLEKLQSLHDNMDDLVYPDEGMHINPYTRQYLFDKFLQICNEYNLDETVLLQFHNSVQED